MLKKLLEMPYQTALKILKYVRKCLDALKTVERILGIGNLGLTTIAIMCLLRGRLLNFTCFRIRSYLEFYVKILRLRVFYRFFIYPLRK